MEMYKQHQEQLDRDMNNQPIEELTYHNASKQLQAFLHTIELQAVYRALRSLTGNAAAAEKILRARLLSHREASAWNTELNMFFQMHGTMDIRIPKHDMIAYYWLAGCGINRIKTLLKCGQSTIYTERDRLLTRKYMNGLEGMWRTDPQTVDNLQHILSHLILFDGLRVMNPIEPYTNMKNLQQ